MNDILREIEREEKEKRKRREEKRREEKRREEKPYPDWEILLPLGGHLLLPSTTPMPDSFIHSFSEEKREEERRQTKIIMYLECTEMQRVM